MRYFKIAIFSFVSAVLSVILREYLYNYSVMNALSCMFMVSAYYYFFVKKRKRGTI